MIVKDGIKLESAVEYIWCGTYTDQNSFQVIKKKKKWFLSFCLAAIKTDTSLS